MALSNMISRVRIGSQQKPSRLASPTERPLFGAHRPLRPLRVLADSELLPQDFEWSKLGLLTGLLTHELIETYRFADEGPPDDEPRLEDLHGVSGDRWVKGWAILGDHDPAYDAWPVYWADEHSRTEGSVWGNAHEAAARHTDSTAYLRETPDNAAELRRRDAVAAGVAESVQADLYITRREYLHSLNWSLASDVTFMTPEQALPFIGLYLRAQGEFYVMRWKGGSHTVNRGLFYLIGAREILPGSWRWFAGCAQHSSAAGTDRLLHLGQSALQRVDRVLELRDQVHRALNQPQDNDVADDALVAFDSALVFLVGALDAVARVAHQVLGIAGSARDVGWRRERWLKKTATAAPDLAGLVEAGTPGAAVLTVLGTLRNTVHSAGLAHVGIATARMERQRTLINLSSGVEGDELVALLDAMDLLGGRADWGVEELVPGLHFVDSGRLLDRLVAEAVKLMNELMAATPLEQLSGVTLTREQCRPPAAPRGTFSERNRESIRWQLGL
ncbi:hypothetical protein GCU60_19600 [Blastococcus saxobsidens]|uniref:Uncharacterized protein n=1 Tax=Blastococcus saxobsidens TaxID=138336 RepID=A0A6L9W7A9_9ACTN|nr:hypothetical protein [Blastococcus saxobsidens]NEK87948.1 hypothetical protein [Blastococcus saxobsidens]